MSDQPTATKKRRPGRPEGAKTVERPVAISRPACCPTCQSSRRESYRDGPIAKLDAVIRIDGQTYNRETWRNTRCLDCGQNYRVIEYSYEPEERSENGPTD